MRLRVIAILALLVASLIFLSAAQAPDYSGKAKIVMKLTKMPDMPAMPQAETSNSFGLTAATFGMPVVPQGTMLQGEVLYSSDPTIKAGQTFSLYINYDQNNEPLGFQSGLVDQLKSGAVVGINEYAVQGNQITVNVGTSADWKSKVFIVDTQYTSSGETKNPFMINLNGFRQFDALPSFNYSTEFKPMFNTSSDVWNWNTNPMSNSHSFFGGQNSTGLFSMFSRLFG
jgi:hypothetical protein